MPRPVRRDTDRSTDPVAGAIASLLPMHAAISVPALADAVSNAAESILGAPFAFVYLEDEEGRLGRVEPASELRRRSQQHAFDALGAALPATLDADGPAGLADAIAAQAPCAISIGEVCAGALDATAAAAAQASLGVRRATIAPLDAAGEHLGALLMLSAERAPDARVRAVADHAACALVNLRQPAAAGDAAVPVAARPVFDARKLEKELQRELVRTARYEREVSIVIVEATNLRLLCERFGDALTERLVQRLGDVLATHARETDLVGAYKESGYTTVLTEAPADGAAAAARRLLQRATEARLADDGVPGLELHIIAGWATSPADGKTAEALFAAAEARLYSVENQTRVA